MQFLPSPEICAAISAKTMQNLGHFAGSARQYS
jgi:hypothetical protein